MMRHVKHIYCPRTPVLTWRLDPLHDLFRVLPKTEETFWSIIRTADLEYGLKHKKFQDFQDKKERILIFSYLLENTSGLNRGQIRTLADAVLIRRDAQVVLGLLKFARKEDKGSTSGRFFSAAAEGFVKNTLRIGESPNQAMEALWKEANNFASSVSESDFLSYLNTTPVDECLYDAVVEAKETAFAFFGKLIESLVDGIGQQIFSIQKEECDKQIQREITSEEDKELGIIRSEFVHQVEDLSRKRSRSYVHYIIR
jgi:hypothetical protein